MNNMKKTYLKLSAIATAALVAGCAMQPGAQDIDLAVSQAMKSSFREQGDAKLDRLVLDASNQACSDAQDKSVDEKLAKAIEEANLKTVKFPADGKLLGNWAEGEKIAQNGRGLTWTEIGRASCRERVLMPV